MNKDEKKKTKLSILDDLNNLDQEAKIEAANFHLEITKVIHTIELMRWYGLYRNGGHYSSDSLFNIKKNLEPMLEKDRELQEKIDLFYPKADQLKKEKTKKLKPSRTMIRAFTRVIEGNSLNDEVNINDQMYGAKTESNNEFFLNMLEKGACLFRPRHYVDQTSQKITLLLLTFKHKKAMESHKQEHDECLEMEK